MKRYIWIGLLVLLVGLACSRGEKPLATYGGKAITSTDMIQELDFFLEEGRTLADVGLTPETFLDRMLRFRLLLDAAERSTPRLGQW